MAYQSKRKAVSMQGIYQAEHTTNDFQVGKWRIHLVDLGDNWGLNGCLTCERKDLGQIGLPFVEFYDMSQDSTKFPEGQFVSRYYMETLLGLDGDPKDSLFYIVRNGGRLSLEGSNPSWSLTNEETMFVGWELDNLAETKYQDRMDHPLDPEPRPAKQGFVLVEQRVKEAWDSCNPLKFIDDSSWEVRSVVALRNWGIDKLVNDPSPIVRKDALSQVHKYDSPGCEHAATIEDWVQCNRNRCALPENRPPQSLKEVCEQAKQASVALNDQSSNQPIKSQEVR